MCLETVSICCMSVLDRASPDDLVGLDAEDLAELGRRLKREHLRRRMSFRTCEHCGRTWLARADARYCQAKCRLAAFRARKKAVDD